MNSSKNNLHLKALVESTLGSLSKDTTKVALAVSGGADSMFMAMIFVSAFTKIGVEPIILIVDHGLREGSAAEAKWVKNYLISKLTQKEGFSIKVKILKADIEKDINSNIQEVARNARYKTLVNYCKKHDVNHLFLAHNLDDQAETVFMRIERGSGLDGACGISPVSFRYGIFLHRPLLDVSRETLVQLLKDEGWNWVDDPSNENMQYKRVKVRKFLKTYDDYNQLISRFGLFAKNVSRTSNFIKNCTDAEFSKIARIDKLCYITIDLKEFLSLHEEIKLRVLIRAMNQVSGGILKPRLDNLSALLSRIERTYIAYKTAFSDVSRETSETHVPQIQKEFKGETFSGCEIVMSGTELFIFRELKNMEFCMGARKTMGDNTNVDSEEFVMREEPEIGEIFDNRFNILQKCKEEGLAVKPLGFKGYCILKEKLGKMPKLFSTRAYYVLPCVCKGDEENLVAVYQMYGKWQDYIEIREHITEI